jgi:hypothetical protein
MDEMNMRGRVVLSQHNANAAVRAIDNRPYIAMSILALLPVRICSGREINKLHTDVGAIMNRPLC